MENQPPAPNPVPETEVPVVPEIIPTPELLKSPSRFNIKLIIIFIILFILISAVGLLAYQYMQPKKQVDPNVSTIPIQSNKKTSLEESSYSLEDKIVFTKDPDKEAYSDLQAWIMNPDGTDKEQLDINNNLGVAYKWLGNSKIIYTSSSNEDQGVIFIKDLKTDSVAKIEPVKHPDPKVTTRTGIQGLRYVAPDFSTIIVDIMFTQPCEKQDLPSQGQGGSGPCMPEPLPDLPMGSYLYDIASKERLYLGDTIMISRWDMLNQVLYVNNMDYGNKGLDKIDLKTKKTTRIDNANTFGYAAYPLLTKNKLIKSIGEAGTPSSFSKLIQVDTTDNSEIEIANSNNWADIQPHLSVSPNENTVIYVRSSNVQGFHLDSLYKLDTSSGIVTQLTPSSNNLSYSNKGVWVDNDTYITLVDTVEIDEYYNGNNYLVSINVKTGEITRLTENNDVNRFTSLY